ncbi:MAG: roadblock/LC7 domain-containing protein [Candidatus Nanopelagicales bacterium]
MSDLPVVGRAARLDRALADLLGQAPELEAAAVVSFDGLAMASALPAGMDEDRVAAMSAALLSLGEKAADGLGRGDLSQVYVEGESGTVFLISCDDEAVLVAVAAAGAKAGLMLFEVRRAAAAIAAVLTAEPHVEQAAPVDEASLADAEAAYEAHKAAQAQAEAAQREAAERAQRDAALAFVPSLAPAPMAPAPVAAVPVASVPPILVPVASAPPAPPAPVAAAPEPSVEDAASAAGGWTPSYAGQAPSWS